MDGSSDTGSDTEPVFESIIATRARRSNAGSRLRQLLDLEEINTDITSTNDDDDNVRLLFMEDEDDQEFEVSDADDENDGAEGEEGEDEDDEKERKDNDRKDNREVPENEEGSEHEDGGLYANNDEMLSDSDVSASDNDESEGERELQKQERLNKRRKRRAELPQVLQKKPKIVKPTRTIKKPHRSRHADLEPIAPGERRHSARRATVQNSIATHEKLEKEYERRQTQAPVSKKEYVEKSLEERFEEAKTTEKENTLSLTRFYEQEVQKKKRQRDMANARKFKMTNFIRFWSTASYVTPLDEIETIEEQERLIKEEEEKKSKRKLQYQKRKQARLANKSTLDEGAQQAPSEDIATSIHSNEVVKVEDKIDDHMKSKDAELTVPSNVDENTKPQKGAENKNGEDSTKTVRFNDEVTISGDLDTKVIHSGVTDNVGNGSNDELVGGDKHNDKENNNNEENIDSENIDSENTEKEQVLKRVFEGPSQCVTRDYVIFEEFDDDISNEEAKKYLFGQQSVLTGTHRDPHYKTICIIKQDESSNIDLQKIQAAREESFQSLIKLPKFGEKIAVIDDSDRQLSTDANEVVNIQTPAPVGIHLPNGQRKMCLTTGLPAMYYDPTNGVPYATVDAFRVLKSLVDGDYGWVQLDNGGINSRYKGGVGYYVSKKNERHAKGVPEGF